MIFVLRFEYIYSPLLSVADQKKNMTHLAKMYSYFLLTCSVKELLLSFSFHIQIDG